MDNKIIAEDAFKSDTQSFGITSEPNTTFIIYNKDGKDVAKYDSVRPDTKVCRVTLSKTSAPYTVKFKFNEPEKTKDEDDLTGATVI